MAEFIKIRGKDSMVQNEISQTSEKHNKQTYATQSEIGQNAINRKKSFWRGNKLNGRYD